MKTTFKIPLAQIRDILFMVLIILGLIVLLASPIWLTFYMPTGT